MLNKALKAIREFHKLSISELASELGISKSYLSEIESGIKTNVSLKIIGKYADFFGVRPSSILLFSEKIQDGESNHGYKLRKYSAKKIIQLMKWINSKD